jgi:PAS domain S-box
MLPPVTHAVIVTDVDGTITHWNDGAEELFGHRAADALGQPVDLLVPVHLREAHWTGFHRAMAHPQVKDMAADLPILCADGQVRTFPGRLLVLSDGLGVAVGAMGIYASTGTTGLQPFS